ncbi:MAG: class II glutamine amidotransferase, partial [Alphaproteobacteria bacterium]
GRNKGPRDGWGVAFYDGNDVSLFREPEPVSESKLVQYIEQNSPPSPMIISHIRRATHGDRILCNTHPFARELSGRQHIFAHNGDLTGIQHDPDFIPGRYHPVGDTDSELAFCILLDRLAHLWKAGQDIIPSLEARLDIIADFAADLRVFGPANFLYADADILFAHAHRRHQPDGGIHPPGLYLLQRSCREGEVTLADGGVTLPPQHQDVILVASIPLTDEPWLPLAEGEIVAISKGHVREHRLVG